VSSLLLATTSLHFHIKLIQEVHSTVEGTVKDLVRSGWKRTKILKLGAILVWEKQYGHRHIGFYIGNKKAISNSTTRGVPVRHHYTFGIKNGKTARTIETIYWNKKLNQ